MILTASPNLLPRGSSVCANTQFSVVLGIKSCVLGNRSTKGATALAQFSPLWNSGQGWFQTLYVDQDDRSAGFPDECHQLMWSSLKRDQHLAGAEGCKSDHSCKTETSGGRTPDLPSIDPVSGIPSPTMPPAMRAGDAEASSPCSKGDRAMACEEWLVQASLTLVSELQRFSLPQRPIRRGPPVSPTHSVCGGDVGGRE